MHIVAGTCRLPKPKVSCCNGSLSQLRVWWVECGLWNEVYSGGLCSRSALPTKPFTGSA